MTISYAVLDEHGSRVGPITWSKPSKLLPRERLSARFTRVDVDSSWPIEIEFSYSECRIEVTTLPNNKDWSEYRHTVTITGNDIEKVTEAINNFCQEKFRVRKEIQTGLPKLDTVRERVSFLLNYIFRGKTIITVENHDSGRWDI